ncbi:sensor domain-containing diguanylate cyclase [Leeia oryzae]|uniref:sensor domain-containing diguanylate cyclase n=1 Tax=Leeia oryzae TaxID=356662 RepID=UPI000361F882|nr:GAF domain-containing protein [Leeia oryzae]
MLPAPIPVNEPERIASLRRMLMLSTPDEEAFDRVTRTAQRMFNVPVVLISLIDENRQWFKSCIGLPVRETGRDVSFCGHAILKNELFVIENALQDERFADNPLVLGPPHVIFYAGRPLRNPEGFLIGTLCLIDHAPRTFTPDDRKALEDLGHWIELIFLGRELSESQRAMLDELDESRRNQMLDPMLNIWRYDAVTDMLKREVSRSYRIKKPLALLLIEIDGMDKIVAEHGSGARDAAHLDLVRNLKSVMRAFDTIGRYRESQFLVILPEADEAHLTPLIERLTWAVTALPCLVADALIDITVSIGLCYSDFLVETPNALELLRRAELALHAGRRDGKTGQITRYLPEHGDV